jgi:hypothetical protein
MLRKLPRFSVFCTVPFLLSATAFAQRPVYQWLPQQTPLYCPPQMLPIQPVMPGYGYPNPYYSPSFNNQPEAINEMEPYPSGSPESTPQMESGQNASETQTDPVEQDADDRMDMQTGDTTLDEPLAAFGSGAGDSTPSSDIGTGLPYMGGDFFGSTSGGRINLLFPFNIENITPVLIGPGALGYDVGGSAGIDLFSLGAAAVDGTIAIAEPINPTDAPLPSDLGLTDFTYAGGLATPVAGTNLVNINYAYSQEFLLPSSPTSLLGRQKITENGSPIPEDRYYFNYSYFDETPLAGTTNVHRWSPGFEKTICGGDICSIEIRLPMAVTLDSRVDASSPNHENFELGNIFASYKLLLYRDCHKALSIGMSASAPTADDLDIFVRIQDPNQPGNVIRRQVLKVDNQSTHVLPFVGGTYQIGNFFQQGFIQADIDVNGSTVYANTDLRTSTLNRAGRLQDQNFLYMDYQAGYWLARGSRRGEQGLTGLAPIGEVHINRSINSSDTIKYENSTVSLGGIKERTQIVNVLAGLVAEFNYNTQVTAAYCTPIGNRSDAEFDGELKLLFNRLF